jgi:hypothetical protein
MDQGGTKFLLFIVENNDFVNFWACSEGNLVIENTS